MRRWLAVLVLAALPRIAHVATVSEDRFLAIDGHQYRELSEHIAAGNGFSIRTHRYFEPRPSPDAENGLRPDVFLPPFLPYAGAVLIGLPGGWLPWAKAVAVLFGVFLVAATGLLGRTLAGPRAGLLAAAIMALHPLALRFTGYWSTETPFACALVAATTLLIRSRATAREWFTLGLAGFLYGAAVLVRPNGLAILLGAGAWILFRPSPRRRARHRRYLLPVCFLLGSLVPLTPWMLRNHQVTGWPNPVTSFGPYNVWRGWNEPTYEMYEAGSDAAFREAMARVAALSQTHVRTMEKRGIHEPEDCNRYWLNEALTFVRRSPREALSILFHRGLHFLRPAPHRAVVSRPLFWLSLATVGPLMLLALWAVARTREGRRVELWIPGLVGGLSSLFFVFSLRYRFPVLEPFVICAAAVAVLELWSRLRQRRTTTRRVRRSEPSSMTRL